MGWAQQVPSGQVSITARLMLPPPFQARACVAHDPLSLTQAAGPISHLFLVPLRSRLCAEGSPEHRHSRDLE